MMNIESRLTSAERAVAELTVSRGGQFEAIDKMHRGMATAEDIDVALEEVVESVRAAIAIDARWLINQRAAGREPSLTFLQAAAAGIAALPPDDEVPRPLLAIVEAAKERCWPPPVGQGSFGKHGQLESGVREDCFILVALRTPDGLRLRREIDAGFYDEDIETEGQHITRYIHPLHVYERWVEPAPTTSRTPLAHIIQQM